MKLAIIGATANVGIIQAEPLVSEFLAHQVGVFPQVVEQYS